MPQVGQTLRVVPGTASDVASTSYQWLRGGNPIAGATNEELLLTPTDEGQTIQVRQDATNFMGTTSSTSPATEAVAPTAVPAGASAFLDYANRTYFVGGQWYKEPMIPGRSFVRVGARAAPQSNGSSILFPTGVPRITDRGLRLSPGGTNDALHSGNLANAYWDKTRLTTTDIGGGEWRLQCTAFSSSWARLARAGVFAADGDDNLQTWELRAGNHSKIAIGTAFGPTTFQSAAAIDLSDGSVLGTTNSPILFITPMEAGWWRVSVRSEEDFDRTAMRVTLINPAFTSGNPTSGGNINWTSDGSEYIEARRPMATISPTPIDYIPSTDAAGAAGADEYLLSGPYASNDIVFLQHEAGTATSTWGALENDGAWDLSTPFDGWSGAGFVQELGIIAA